MIAAEVLAVSYPCNNWVDMRTLGEFMVMGVAFRDCKDEEAFNAHWTDIENQKAHLMELNRSCVQTVHNLVVP